MRKIRRIDFFTAALISPIKTIIILLKQKRGVGVFNQCEQNQDILAVIKSWSMVHPLMRVIPVEWEHVMPVGILYSPQPSQVVSRFLSALEKVLAQVATSGYN